MGNVNRPLLAATLTEENIQRLKYPVFASPKLDGIRMRVFPELGGVSRVHKLLPNKYLQEAIKQHPEWAYKDGEVIVGDPTHPNCFNITQSGIMSEGGQPDFKFWVFDDFKNPNEEFKKRYASLFLTQIPGGSFSGLVPHIMINTYEELLFEEMKWISSGYEGLMVRSLTGKYKFGRSTENEGILFKLKRFQDAEGVITGSKPLTHNTNDAQKDELGYTRRSTHKDNKVEDELLGAFLVSSEGLADFELGSGYNLTQRMDFWHKRDGMIGKTVTFKYFGVGTNNRPRHPIFKGLRHD